MMLSACGGGGGGGGSDSTGTSPNPPASSGSGSASTMSAMAQLGQKLFTDTALSASNQQACATCHVPTHAFADGNGLSASIGGPNMDLQGLRNAPALAYSQYAPAFRIEKDGSAVGGFFRDGRASSLAEQAKGPFVNPFEMANASNGEVLTRLLTRPYLDEFKSIFGTGALNDGDATVQNMALAIAQYEKEEPAFRTFDSKYDAYIKGTAQLTPQELNGLAIFNNPAKANCTACHTSTPTATTPALFTDFSYDNVGLPRNWKLRANIDGQVPDYAPKNGANLGEPNHEYYDLGLCGPLRTDLASRTSLCGAFKVPTLRNIALTAPYFHNGVFDTLEEAVAWYITRNVEPQRWYRKADGSPDILYNDLPVAYRGNVNVSEVPYIPGLAPTLSNSEMADLVHFLCTLTDGYDPANPSAYRWPAQCNATEASLAAVRAGTPPTSP